MPYFIFALRLIAIFVLFEVSEKSQSGSHVSKIDSHAWKKYPKQTKMNPLEDVKNVVILLAHVMNAFAK